MKKKIVSVGLLAGGIALTGLTGAAWASGGASLTGSAKPHGPDGKPVAIACVGKAGPGKPGDGGKLVFNTEGPGKGLPVPPPGTGPKFEQHFVAGDKTTGTPPPGVEGAGKVEFDPSTHHLKIDTGAKGIRCFEVPGGAGALPPGSGDMPPLPPIEPTPSR